MKFRYMVDGGNKAYRIEVADSSQESGWRKIAFCRHFEDARWVTDALNKLWDGAHSLALL